MKPHRGTSLLMDGNGGGGKAFAVWFSASSPSPLSKTPEKQSSIFIRNFLVQLVVDHTLRNTALGGGAGGGLKNG